MAHLHQALAARVADWRETGYAHEAHPAIAEILEYQVDLETGMRHFLRAPQLQALENYWYLRLVQQTPHILDLYRDLFPTTTELLDAMGLRQEKQARYVRLCGGEAGNGAADRPRCGPPHEGFR